MYNDPTPDPPHGGEGVVLSKISSDFVGESIKINILLQLHFLIVW